MSTRTIRLPRLVLVEGKDEKHLVEVMVNHLQLPDVQVEDGYGRTNENDERLAGLFREAS